MWLTIKTAWDFLLDSLDNILLLKVDGDDIGAKLLGHGQSGRHRVDHVDLRSALQERPLDTGELQF